MALFMNRDDLEALRPAHVSMRAMRWWWRMKVALRASGVVFLSLTVAAVLYPGLVPAVKVSFAIFLANVLAWLCLLLACFVRYSLATLMAVVFGEGLMLALYLSLPLPWFLVPGFFTLLLPIYLYISVIEYDPQGLPAFFHSKGVAAADGRASDPEPRA